MKKFKHILLIALVGLIVLTAMGCSNENSESNSSKAEDGEPLVIGIIQHAEHIALDRAREGFVEALEDKGIDFVVIYENAQGDLSLVPTLAQNMIQKDVDLLYAIATPTAQGAKNALMDTEIPLIFNAVTDPVGSGLVENVEAPEGQVTGVSDYFSPAEQLDKFLEVFPEIETIGTIYSTNEANSQAQIEELQAACDAKGIKFIVKGINNINDAGTAITSLTPQIDGYFAITDNMTSSAAAVIGNTLKEGKVPSFSAEVGPVENGLLMTDGVSYEELGRLAAEQAEDLLINGKKMSEVPVRYVEETERVVNDEVREALGLDPSLFE